MLGRGAATYSAIPGNLVSATLAYHFGLFDITATYSAPSPPLKPAPFRLPLRITRSTPKKYWMDTHQKLAFWGGHRKRKKSHAKTLACEQKSRRAWVARWRCLVGVQPNLASDEAEKERQIRAVSVISGHLRRGVYGLNLTRQPLACFVVRILRRPHYLQPTIRPIAAACNHLNAQQAITRTTNAR